MKAVTEYTIEEAAKMSATCKELFEKAKGTTRRDWFEDFRQTSGYAHYKFSGRLSDKLVELLGQKPVVDTVLEMMDTYKERSQLLGSVAEEALTAPPELLRWLTEELTEDPDYYLNDIYDGLKETYRPILRIDERAMMPVYDENYSGILDKILERFYKYEDDYYAQDN